MNCAVCDMINEIEKAFIGLIFLWYGAIEDIPDGWQLCDGTNGTPDLRNRFLVCSQSTVILPPGNTGGIKEHAHHFTGDGHAHDFPFEEGFLYPIPFRGLTTFSSITGNTDMENNIPPYKALCYIMKPAL